MLREALSLPGDDRADIAAELAASLDDESADGTETVQAVWHKELEELAKRVVSGDTVEEEWATVRAAASTMN